MRRLLQDLPLGLLEGRDQPPSRRDRELERAVQTQAPGWHLAAITRWAYSQSPGQRQALLASPPLGSGLAILEVVSTGVGQEDPRGASRMWCESLLLRGWAELVQRTSPDLAWGCVVGLVDAVEGSK